MEWFYDPRPANLTAEFRILLLTICVEEKKIVERKKFQRFFCSFLMANENTWHPRHSGKASASDAHSLGSMFYIAPCSIRAEQLKTSAIIHPTSASHFLSNSNSSPSNSSSSSPGGLQPSRHKKKLDNGNGQSN